MSTLFPHFPVLLIEDNADIAEVVSMLLEAEGYKTTWTTSREQAVKALDEYSPHAIIMDYLMPGMDASRFVLHARRSCPECKIVLMTGSDDAKAAALSLGLDAWFQKPDEIDALAHYIGRLQP